jgi:hypothetical protein
MRKGRGIEVRGFQSTVSFCTILPLLRAPGPFLPIRDVVAIH